MRAALQVALDGAANAGAETELLDLHELGLPIYNPDNDGPTPAVARLIESCYAADGMLWSSPMYQGTISGAFKNAVDWLHVLGGRKPPFLHYKVIGLISAADGTQGLQAINTDGVRVRALRGWACPTSFRLRPRRASSMPQARSRITRLSCSSRRSATRSCALPSGSEPMRPFTASMSARRRRTRCDTRIVPQPSGRKRRSVSAITQAVTSGHFV